MSGPTFLQELANLRPVDWKKTAATEPPKGLLVEPHVITCEGRTVGLLDGVAAAHLLQGTESTRLLVAVQSWANELGKSLHSANNRESMRLLLQLNGILTTLHTHFEASYNEVDTANRKPQ